MIQKMTDASAMIIVCHRRKVDSAIIIALRKMRQSRVCYSARPGNRSPGPFGESPFCEKRMLRTSRLLFVTDASPRLYL